MRKYFSILTACLLPLSGVMADNADAPLANSLDERDSIPRARTLALDTDGDGFISRDEAASDSDLLKDFDKRDSNGDGRLSESELSQHNAPPQLSIPLPGTEDAKGQKKSLGITIKPATTPDSGFGIGH